MNEYELIILFLNMFPSFKLETNKGLCRIIVEKEDTEETIYISPDLFRKLKGNLSPL